MKRIATLYFLLLFVNHIASAQSQVIKGTIKATPKNSITILPVSTELKSPEIEKSVEYFYPTTTTPPFKTDLKAKVLKPGTKILSTYKKPIIIEPAIQNEIDSLILDSSNKQALNIATKKDDFGQSVGLLNPMEPIKADSTNQGLSKKEIKKDDFGQSVGLLNPIEPVKADSKRQELSKKEIKKDSFGQSVGILDPLESVVSSNPDLVKKVPPKHELSKKVGRLNRREKINSSNRNKVFTTHNKPIVKAKENIVQKSPKIVTKNQPVQELKTISKTSSNEDKYLVEGRSTESILNTEKVSNDNNVINPSQKTEIKANKKRIIPTGKQDYKFFVSPDGKFNIVFTKDGNSISVTSFGRIAGVTFSSVDGDAKPIYNYRGLLETVGSITIQYNYEGRVSKINECNITYNFNGNIELVHIVTITYNFNGTTNKIANSKIQYDFNGLVSSIDSNPLIVLKQ